MKSWFSVANILSILHGINNMRLKVH